MINRAHIVFLVYLVTIFLAGCNDNSSNKDNIAPEIILNGPNLIEMVVGEQYTDLGAVAFDNLDGNITNQITLSQNVDTSTVGKYSIVYKIVDSHGNRSSVSRVVEVKSGPNKKPIVEAGKNKIVYLNNLFLIQGSATDSDGEVVKYKWEDINHAVLCQNTELSHTLKVLGSYVFTFEAEDDRGAVSSDTVVVQSVLESNFLNEGKLQSIKDLIKRAYVGGKNITYITAGDSKRDFFVDYKGLYADMLSKINITYKHNASSGISAQEWANRTRDTDVGIAKTVKDATGNKGSLTIVEYSLGANDWNNASGNASDIYADIYPHIKKGITEIQKKLPNAKIFLVNPIGTHRPELKQVYRDLANEFNLPMMENPMDKYRDNSEVKSDYFHDDIHPNLKGAKRLVYNILYNVSDTEPKEKIIDTINKEIDIFL